jgi:hypothetical protein
MFNIVRKLTASRKNKNSIVLDFFRRSPSDVIAITRRKFDKLNRKICFICHATAKKECSQYFISPSVIVTTKIFKISSILFRLWLLTVQRNILKVINDSRFQSSLSPHSQSTSSELSEKYQNRSERECWFSAKSTYTTSHHIMFDLSSLRWFVTARLRSVTLSEQSVHYQVVHKFVEKFNLGLRTLNWVKLRLSFKFEG